MQLLRWPQRRGQVAPMLLIIMLLTVVMTLVTVNIGKVALLKTNTAVAADSAALGAASTLGTMARAVCSSIRNTPEPGLCKKCKFGGILGNLLIASALYLTGNILAAEYWAQKTVFLDQMQLSRQNAQIRRNLPPKLAIKLSAYLVALAGVVDDPRVVKDDTDIDQDGDRTEMVSLFAVWFEQRFKKIDDQVVAKLGPEVGEWTDRLTKIRDVVVKFRDYLKDDFIPYVKWIEDNYDGRGAFLPNPLSTPLNPLPPVFTRLGPVDVPFWKPGDQGAHLCKNGIPCGDCTDPDSCTDSCGVDVVPPGSENNDNADDTPVLIPDFPPGIRPCDETEFVLLAVEQFLTFADNVLSSSYDVKARSLGEWVDALKYYGAVEFESWMEMIDGYPLDRFPRRQLGWRQILSNLKAQMPWPPDPSYGVPWPPGVPNPLPGRLPHPNDYVNQALKGHKDDIGFWVNKLRKKTINPVDIPIDPKDFIYSWQDKRGWHHVGAEVSDFKLPRPETQSGWSFSSCVVGKNVGGTVKVTVRRFDEDRKVNRLWDFRQRQKSGNPSPNPASPDSLKFGVVSVAEADYWWKNDGIRIKSAK